jgi:hypothetical protein
MTCHTFSLANDLIRLAYKGADRRDLAFIHKLRLMREVDI